MANDPNAEFKVFIQKYNQQASSLHMNTPKITLADKGITGLGVMWCLDESNGLSTAQIKQDMSRSLGQQIPDLMYDTIVLSATAKGSFCPA